MIHIVKIISFEGGARSSWGGAASFLRTPLGRQQKSKVFCVQFSQDVSHISFFDGRCAGCDEIIFEKDYIFEGEKSYHKRHFCCAICDVDLTGILLEFPSSELSHALLGSNTYVPHAGQFDHDRLDFNGSIPFCRPHCFDCFAEHFADKCVECTCAINPMPGFGGKVLVIDNFNTKHIFTLLYFKISNNGKHWHKACFNCKNCRQPLVGVACIPTSRGLFCKMCHKSSRNK